jgi:putative ABC transport system permease protein
MVLSLSLSVMMMGNHMKIFLRTLKKHKGFSFLNIFGLSLGITGSLLISLWVHSELNINRFNRNYHRIYRLELENDQVLSPGVGKILEGKIPEIEHCIRFMLRRNSLLSHDHTSITVPAFLWADAAVFDVFTFPLIMGNPKTALKNPNSVILTEKTAQALFADMDPLGQEIRLNQRSSYTVTGLIKEFPGFHLPFAALASFKTQEAANPRRFVEMMHDGFEHPTFVLLSENHNAVDTAQKINRFFKEQEIFKDPKFLLRPLKDVYFTPSVLAGARSGNRSLVYVFVLVAFFLLFIAAVNFINLSTARAARRAKEIGIKKVIGFQKKNLVFQFLMETVGMSLVSFFFGLAIVKISLPAFNRMIAGNLSIHSLTAPLNLAGCTAAAVCLGLIAGFYPAVYLASLQPVPALRSEGSFSRKSGSLRRGLVVLQFSISLILIIGTLTVLKQVHFMKHSSLGFEKEHVIILHMNSQFRSKGEVFKQKLLQHPGILNASFACRVPGENWWRWGLDIPGVQDYIKVNSIDPDYLEVMGMELLQGRNFSWDQTTDRWNQGENGRRKIILNETAVRILGLDSPLGLIGGPSRLSRYEVVGVVKDFHFNSLHSLIEPLIFYWDPRQHGELGLKIGTENVPHVIEHIQKTWKEFSPEFPFTFSFLDEVFDQQYQKEKRLSGIFKAFAFLTIFVASLGLVGLAAYVAERRKKEIGIRKVCGASVPGILGLISRDFSIWVLTANAIAWPAAYFIMRKWLEGFAYRTGLNLWIFLGSAGIALVFTLAAVGFQAFKAAASNPVDSLRYE